MKQADKILYIQRLRDIYIHTYRQEVVFLFSRKGVIESLKESACEREKGRERERER